MIIYMTEDLINEKDMKRILKSREKELYWWTAWEGRIYDGKIKINRNPKFNLKNKTEVKNTPQLKPFKVKKSRNNEVIGAFQHTSK